MQSELVLSDVEIKKHGLEKVLMLSLVETWTHQCRGGVSSRYPDI